MSAGRKQISVVRGFLALTTLTILLCYDLPFPRTAKADGTSQGREFTDAELRAFDGTDPDTPIYLGINGTIFDVSSGRSFYGPGGHYGHFAGRDAVRAWVTECWDSEDQLTPDMRGIEEMFMPRYMDEELADTAEGKGPEGSDSVQQQAAQIIERFGKVDAKERNKRREDDRSEALEKVQSTLQTWVNFFAKSDKYPEVGKVVREAGWEDSAPPPPAICEAAMKKRPVRGGKLESLMQGMPNMGGSAGTAGKESTGGMPDHVKQKLAAKQAAKHDEL